LVGLFEHPLLKSGLIFKGGTALKKCYFGEYRFSEDLDFSVTAHCPKGELLLKAIIEYRSRIRDYYDLWRIFGSFEGDLSFDDFVSLLRQKCAFKQVVFSGAESFFDPRMINNVLNTWQKWLGPLVPRLPPCNQVLDELKVKVKSLLKSLEHEVALIIHAIAQNKLRGEALYEVIDKAIRSGIDVKQGTSNGHYLLQNIIKANLDSRMKLQLVKQLVDLGAKVDAPDKSSLTPFATAVASGEKMIADFLHAKGAAKRVPIHMHAQFYSMYLQTPMN
jgi:hypothetical protein